MTTSTALLLTTIGTLIVVLALLILFHQNMNATKGYRLRSLERERSQLLLEQEVQNMEIAKAQALETLEADNKVQSMKGVKKPQYIRTDSTVAQKSTLQNVE